LGHNIYLVDLIDIFYSARYALCAGATHQILHLKWLLGIPTVCDHRVQNAAV
jgi:hypothetical protein